MNAKNPHYKRTKSEMEMFDSLATNDSSNNKKGNKKGWSLFGRKNSSHSSNSISPSEENSKNDHNKDTKKKSSPEPIDSKLITTDDTSKLTSNTTPRVIQLDSDITRNTSDIAAA